MINGIKPEISKPKPKVAKPSTNGLSFDEAMINLLVKIQDDYTKWGSRTGIDKVLELKLNKGRKFIKVIEGNRVWGFVAKVDGTHKGLPMKKGDIMKAAGWRGPANIVEVVSLIKRCTRVLVGQDQIIYRKVI